MKISDILASRDVTISCELFPPKPGSTLSNAQTVIREIAALKPSFISVTYGAGGGTRETTVAMAHEVQNVNHIPALAHLTCVGSDRDSVRSVLTQLRERGIQNVLALRGDLPPDWEGPHEGPFRHASDLVTEILSQGDFCVGGACYPEGHVDAESLDQDIEALKIKVDCGCQFLTTQMFFDNSVLYGFLYRLLKRGVDVPVLAAVMPIVSTSQIKRMCKLSGSVLPPRFRAIVERFGSDPDAMRQAGIAYTTEQIIDLLANGVRNIHIYTMNKPDIAGAIMGNLTSIFK